MVTKSIHAATGLRNQVRIIGGTLRSRKVHFPAVDGLRPTADRIRETLFNWLNPIITGAHCLDLFAGSGALGIEALSRGAAHVVFIDQHPLIVRALKENLATFGIRRDQFTVLQMNAYDWLKQSVPQPFDIVFLDPPFKQGDLSALCIRLEQHYLHDESVIYLECAKDQSIELPPNWSIKGNKVAGQVHYQLAVRQLRSQAELDF